MLVTVEWLIEEGACPEGIDYFLSQGEEDSVKLIHRLSDEMNDGWARWLALRTEYTGQCPVFYADGTLLGIEHYENGVWDDLYGGEYNEELGERY